MGLFSKKKKETKKTLEKLPQKRLERNMPQIEEEEKAKKEMNNSSRKGKF